MKNSYSRAIILSLIILWLFFQARPLQSQESQGLSSTNQQITVLYIDALNLYKEGRYQRAAQATEDILELLKSDLYVSSVRKALKIQPDETTLRAFLKKMRAKETELQKAKDAFAKGYYSEAEELLSLLREESPQSKEIAHYLERIERNKFKQRQEEKTPLLPEEVHRRLQERRSQQETLQDAQKDALKQEEHLVIERELEAQQLSLQKTKQEQEYQAKQEELRKFKAEQLQRISQTQQEIERQQRKFNAKLSGMKRDAALEKSLSEAMLIKQREDAKKIAKIENLWQEAKALYAQGSYEEAIKLFEEIIELEGNPRIKYTPYAKELIEQAKEKIIQKKESTLRREVNQKEAEMVNEVLNRQVPPYVEPPQSIEKEEGTTLIEPPPIRKKLKNSKVSLEFDKVDLKSVISFLSKESEVNVVASQKVLDLGLKVNVRFTNAPMEEVIKYITKSLGLIYRIDKDVVWIAHPEEIANEALETRVYYLTKGGGLFTEFTAIGGGGTETALGSSSAQINKITTIEDTLKEVVPWPADSKLTFDKRINALIVRNTPQNLQMLEDMLYTLDVVPYQILIEARFLELDITDTKELGLEWKFNENWATDQRKGNKDGLIFAKDSGVDFSSFSRASEGLNLTYKGILTAPKFEAVLHALEESKKIKTLSSPRITTLNNQPAAIKVVDEWIYPTRYEYEIVQYDLNGDGDYNDAGETTYKNVPKDFQRRDVGILLKVIPSVGSDRKTINLSLVPEVSEATADAFSYTGDVKLPKFTSRNLATTIVVTSGDTVVLGGLIKENRTKTATRVPVLGSIPLLGNFFKKDADSIQRKNLLIFVTAKVLSASGEELVIPDREGR